MNSDMKTSQPICIAFCLLVLPRAARAFSLVCTDSFHMIFLMGEDSREKKIVNNPQRIANVCIIHAINVCISSHLISWALFCTWIDDRMDAVSVQRCCCPFNSSFAVFYRIELACRPRTRAHAPTNTSIPRIWECNVEPHLIPFYSFSTWHFYYALRMVLKIHLVDFAFVLLWIQKPRTNKPIIFANKHGLGMGKGKKRNSDLTSMPSNNFNAAEKNVPTQNAVHV